MAFPADDEKTTKQPKKTTKQNNNKKKTLTTLTQKSPPKKPNKQTNTHTQTNKNIQKIYQFLRLEGWKWVTSARNHRLCQIKVTSNPPDASHSSLFLECRGSIPPWQPSPHSCSLSLWKGCSAAPASLTTVWRFQLCLLTSILFFFLVIF